MAADLGVAMPEEGLLLAAPVKPETPNEPAEAAAPEIDFWPPEAASPSDARESLAEAEMALEDLDQWDAEGDTRQQPEEEPERGLRRRRKRRRKTRRPGDRSLVSDEREEDDERPDFLEAEAVEIIEEEVEELTVEPEEEETAGEAQKRSKRRRRRRSSRKKETRETDSLDRAESPVTGEAEEDDFEADEIEDDVDEDVVGVREGRRREKRLHRGIPSWKEAIDVIISANMESRSKRPDRGGRGRGGRNRGQRDRNG